MQELERLWKELTEISWDLHSKDFDIHSALMLLDRDNDEQYDASIVGYNETDANIVRREEGYEMAYEAALIPMSDIDFRCVQYASYYMIYYNMILLLLRL